MILVNRDMNWEGPTYAVGSSLYNIWVGNLQKAVDAAYANEASYRDPMAMASVKKLYPPATAASPDTGMYNPTDAKYRYEIGNIMKVWPTVDWKYFHDVGIPYILNVYATRRTTDSTGMPLLPPSISSLIGQVRNNYNNMIYAQQQSQLQYEAQQAEAKRLYDLQQSQIAAQKEADIAEAKRLTDLAEAQKIAAGIESQRLYDLEQKRLADLAEAKRIADIQAQAESQRLYSLSEKQRVTDLEIEAENQLLMTDYVKHDYDQEESAYDSELDLDLEAPTTPVKLIVGNESITTPPAAKASNTGKMLGLAAVGGFLLYKMFGDD